MNMKLNMSISSFLTTLSISILITSLLSYFGPGIVLAQTSASDTVIVTLNVTAGISIDSPSDVTMSRNIGVAADTAVASTTWTVRTNNVTGYNLTLKASTEPAMQQNSTTTVADVAATTTPATWSVGVGTAAFGFSAYGTDVSTATWGTGGNCEASSHVPSTSLKYAGFRTSTSTVVATRAATTTSAGVGTTVCFAVAQNAFYIPSGTYTATITATAVTI